MSRPAKRRPWLGPPSGSSRRRRRSTPSPKRPTLPAILIGSPRRSANSRPGSERAAWTSSPRCRRRRAAASRVASTVTTGEAACGPGSTDGSLELDRGLGHDGEADRAEAGLAVEQTFDAAPASAAGAVGLNPGESFSVAVNELFDVPAPGSTRRPRGHFVRPVGAGVGVAHPGDGDRGLDRKRRRGDHRPGDRRLRPVPQTRRDEAAVEHTITATPGLSRNPRPLRDGDGGPGPPRQDVVGALGPDGPCRARCPSTTCARSGTAQSTSAERTSPA